MKKTGVLIGGFTLVSTKLSAHAQENGLYESLAQNSGLSEVYETLSAEIQKTLESLGIESPSIYQQGFSVKGLWQCAVSFLEQSITVPIKTLGTVIAILVFCLLFQNLSCGKNTGMNTVLQFFVGFCITVSLAIPLSVTLTKTVTALEEMGGFMMVYLPVYAGVLLAMGRGLTVSGAGGLVFGGCQVITYLAKHIILPFVSMFLAFSVCEATGGGIKTGGFATCVKRTAMWIMGISATAFSGLLCLTGVLNGAADSVTQRTTRFFIGNLIPVVGGALSDSLATLQGCFSLLRGSSGVLGIGVLVAFLLPVLLEILLWRLSVMIMTAVSGVLEMPRVTVLLQSAGEAVGLLLGIVLCSGAVYVVSLSVLMLAGG